MNSFLNISISRLNTLAIIFVALFAISLTSCTKNEDLTTPLAEQTVTAKGDVVAGEGQGDQGDLWGLVQNQNAVAISGATVSIYGNGGTILVATTQTDANGNFYISDVTAGDYEVRISANGFQDVTISPVTIDAEGVTSIGTISMEI